MIAAEAIPPGSILPRPKFFISFLQSYASSFICTKPDDEWDAFLSANAFVVAQPPKVDSRMQQLHGIAQQPVGAEANLLEIMLLLAIAAVDLTFGVRKAAKPL